MNRLDRAFRPGMARSWTRLGGMFTLCCALSACGAQTKEPDVDGQSHWWQLCAEDDDCSEGFQCACGACTRACTAVDACGATQHVRCSLRSSFCQDAFRVAEVNVCQVACTAPSDCPDTLTCHEGVCVNAQILAVEETSTSSLPEQEGGTVPLCGDPPHECPPPPVDWCTFRGNTPLPEDLVEYWSSFCDAGADASVDPASSCGDGILQADEVCDDGNTVSGDGCTSTCDKIEVNFDCGTEGQPCQPG